MIVFGFIGWGGGYISSLGGIRTLLQAFLGNYQMAVERYTREGTKICHLQGRLRLPDGTIQEGSWLIVGTEGSGPFTPVAVFDEKEKRILHIPKNGEFIKAKLQVSDKKWQTLKVATPATITAGHAFFNPSKQWHRAGPGDSVFGFVIYEDAVTLGQAGL